MIASELYNRISSYPVVAVVATNAANTRLPSAHQDACEALSPSVYWSPSTELCGQPFACEATAFVIALGRSSKFSSHWVST